MIMSNKNQQGITWIEIVLIIVILGVITMIALPRFVDFQAASQPPATQDVKH